MSDKIRVILADDHALVLEGLRGLISQQADIEVVATADDGDHLLKLLEQHEVDVVILDVQMPYHGMTALAEIRKRQFPVRVLVLTAFSDGETIQNALEHQAEGFALKTESPSQTIEAIRQVAGGRMVFPQAAQRWMTKYRQNQRTLQETLSSREREVLAQLARGLTNPEIALELSVSENTVRFHLKHIFAKLGVGNRTEAVAWYFTYNTSAGNPLIY
jgi:DNA-binding NarL/FixJ family response regulator